MLYLGKTGAVLVGMLILPQFSRLLGPEQFGIVAVIFSIQALLLLLDLGMSTLVARDVAAAPSEADGYAVWRTGETVVTALYAALAPVTLLLSPWLPTGLSLLESVGCLLLFWMLTLQNVAQSALLARRQFVSCGIVQVAGVLARGIATLLCLKFFGANLSVFISTQLLFSIAQTVAMRVLCRRTLDPAGAASSSRPTRAQCLSLARRGRSLVVFGIAGAAVMQLDKLIVTAFTSTAAIAPYYLATAFSVTPIALLAGPVSQYFQPRLVRAISTGEASATRSVLRRYAMAIGLATLLPSAAIWWLREPILAAWLGHSPLLPAVVEFTAILLPGVTLGALGYVPYGILVAREDFRFQAWASASMTIATLAATVAMARAHNVAGVCLVYAVYHATSTAVSTARCLGLARARNGTREMTAVAVVALAAVAPVLTGAPSGRA
jgi:O-antigen/teichoic acid export membrane protein